MKSSIEIGKYIRNKMINSDKLRKYVDNKIFPMIADEETTFPFIAYSRDTITQDYVKGMGVLDNVEVSIKIVSLDYSESCEIASIVEELFNLKKDENYKIQDSRIIDITENYYENAYIQTLNFKFKTY